MITFEMDMKRTETECIRLDAARAASVRAGTLAALGIHSSKLQGVPCGGVLSLLYYSITLLYRLSFIIITVLYRLSFIIIAYRLRSRLRASATGCPDSRLLPCAVGLGNARGSRASF